MNLDYSRRLENMELKIEVFSGKINTLGDSVTENGMKHIYSYIEMSDGQIIKKLLTIMGIDGQLKMAFDNNENVDLHVNTMTDGSRGLMAIKMGNGRTYALTISTLPFFDRYATIIMILLGVPTIPVFGIGFLLLWGHGKPKTLTSYFSSLKSTLPHLIQFTYSQQAQMKCNVISVECANSFLFAHHLSKSLTKN